MSILPLLVIGGLLLVMVYFSNRSKAKRTAADIERRKSMVPGTRVMMTSGMYGTVTAIDPDNDGGATDTATIEIAPGVRVTWALAAVREAPERVVAAPVAPTTEALDPTADPTADDTRSIAAGGPVRMVKPKGRGAEH